MKPGIALPMKSFLIEFLNQFLIEYLFKKRAITIIYVNLFSTYFTNLIFVKKEGTISCFLFYCSRTVVFTFHQTLHAYFATLFTIKAKKERKKILNRYLGYVRFFLFCCRRVFTGVKKKV